MSRLSAATWSGAIPCLVTLAEHELVSLNPPPPLTLMLNRLSYLPLYEAQIRAHFAEHVPPIEDQLWFDFAGRPLKWHVPIGVLFDLMAGTEDLPWKLQAHFTQFPADTLLRCAGEETARQYYMNSMKEAVYLRLGTVRPVIGMTKQDQEALWESIKAENHERFVAAYRQLTAEGAKMPLKHVPLRVLVWGRPTAQLPIMPTDESGRERCLADALGLFLPDLFPEFAPARPPPAPEAPPAPAPDAPSAPSAGTPPAPTPEAPNPSPADAPGEAEAAAPVAPPLVQAPSAPPPGRPAPSEPAPAGLAPPELPAPPASPSLSPAAPGRPVARAALAGPVGLPSTSSHKKLPPLPPLPRAPPRPPPSPRPPAGPPEREASAAAAAAAAVPAEHGQFTVTVQGIRPALTTGLVWLSEALAHPDGFTYLVVARR
eukprot:tig00000378_g24510.t1